MAINYRKILSINSNEDLINSTKATRIALISGLIWIFCVVSLLLFKFKILESLNLKLAYFILFLILPIVNSLIACTIYIIIFVSKKYGRKH